MAETGIQAIRKTMTFAELARGIGITRGAISQWERVPAERVAEVAKITGLSLEIIRPDLFAKPVRQRCRP